MKNNIQFSILSYYTSIVHTEHINIAVLFQNLETNEVRFESLQKWYGVKSFLRDIDLEMFKILIDGIKEEVEMYNILDNKRFNMKEFIQYYVNELKFSEIISVYDSNFQSFMANTKRMYLTLEYSSEERPDTNEQLKYLKQIAKGKNVNYTSRPVKGVCNDNIPFDCILSERYAIKFFNFKNKNLNKCIPSVKMWAYNAQNLADKYECIFIYNIQDKEINEANREELSIILAILEKAHATIYTIDKGIEFINSLSQDVFDLEELA